MPKRHLFTLIALGLSALLPLGCNIVAPAYVLLHGPEKTKKVYSLDPEKTAVVFIDDRSNRIPRRSSRVLMGQETEHTLLAAKAVKDMISTQSAMLAAGKEVNGQPTPIADIGRAVGADIVIYATVDDFHLSSTGQSFDPGATIRVKVIDAVNDKRLWPAKSEGESIVVRLLAKAQELPTSTAGRFAAEDELAKQAGTEIAWLFVTHETPQGLKSPD